jgi:hypothetical protein
MYYSKDAAGNIETTKTQTVKVNEDKDGDGYSTLCDCNDVPANTKVVRVKVDITRFQDRGLGNFTGVIYLANGTQVKNGQWIDLTDANGNWINDTASSRNVPGLYLQRNDGQVTIDNYGFRKSNCSNDKYKDNAACTQGKEAYEATITLDGASFTDITNAKQGQFENKTASGGVFGDAGKDAIGIINPTTIKVVSAVTTNEDMAVLNMEKDLDGTLFHPGAADNSCEYDYNCNATWVTQQSEDVLLAEDTNSKNQNGDDKYKIYDGNHSKNSFEKDSQLTVTHDGLPNVDGEKIAWMDFDPNKVGDEVLVFYSNGKMEEYTRGNKKRVLAQSFNNVGIKPDNHTALEGGQFFADQQDEYLISKQVNSFDTTTIIYSWDGSKWNEVTRYANDGLQITQNADIAFGFYSGQNALLVQNQFSTSMNAYTFNFTTNKWTLFISNIKVHKLNYEQLALGSLVDDTNVLVDPDDSIDTDGDGFGMCVDQCPAQAGPIDGCPKTVAVTASMLINQSKNKTTTQSVSNVKVYAANEACAVQQVGSWSTFTQKDYTNKSAGINKIIANCAPVTCSTDTNGACNLNITDTANYVSFATNGPAGTPFITNYNRAIYRQDFTIDTDGIDYQWLKSYGCQNQATVTLYTA